MGAVTSSSSRSTITPPTISIPTSSPRVHTSSISPALTHASRSPSIDIPRHIKEKTPSPLSNKLSYHMRRIMIREPPPYQHTPASAWYECENTETNISITNDQDDESSRFEISSPRLSGMDGVDHSPLTLPQPATSVPTTSRTIHIQPKRRLSAYFSQYGQDQSSWLSLEWILATRSATHGLFDAYPYHVFDAFLLRTHPTSRPCLDFLHAEQSFRDKWSGWSPCHSRNAWKISMMIAEAKTLYQTYVIPIMSFLSTEAISRFEDIGLNNSTSIDPAQEMDITPFIHGDMFLPAVHEIMHALRTGPFQSFIQTRQYQELRTPTH